MKRINIVILLIVLISCDNKNSSNNNNPNIPNNSFSFQIDLSLPTFSNLQFTSNNIVKTDVGARGVVVFNTGSGYLAYDLACPNEPYNNCTSAMTITGTNAKCICENKLYNLFTGQCSGQQYQMKQYKVEVNGNSLTVSN